MRKSETCPTFHSLSPFVKCTSCGHGYPC